MMAGNEARKGDIVRLLAMPANIVRDLPPEEAEFLLSSVGDFGTVEEIHPVLTAEIRLDDRASGVIHYVFLNFSDVEFISRGRDA